MTNPEVGRKKNPSITFISHQKQIDSEWDFDRVFKPLRQKLIRLTEENYTIFYENKDEKQSQYK